MHVVKRLIRTSLRLALRVARLRRLVESELRHRERAAARAQPTRTPSTLTRDHFIDRAGVRHELDPLLRDR